MCGHDSSYICVRCVYGLCLVSQDYVWCSSGFVRRWYLWVCVCMVCEGLCCLCPRMLLYNYHIHIYVYIYMIVYVCARCVYDFLEFVWIPYDFCMIVICVGTCVYDLYMMFICVCMISPSFSFMMPIYPCVCVCRICFCVFQCVCNSFRWFCMLRICSCMCVEGLQMISYECVWFSNVLVLLFRCCVCVCRICVWLRIYMCNMAWSCVGLSYVCVCVYDLWMMYLPYELGRCLNVFVWFSYMICVCYVYDVS